MDRSTIKLLFHTIKYLKPIQIYYRLYYFIRNRFFKKKYEKELSPNKFSLLWEDFILNPNSYLGDNEFSFLNLAKDFNKEIDWNFAEYGKLWEFNLNYFDFLNQKNIKIKDGIALIKNFLEKENVLKDGKASYPISLRGINWVKFLAKNNISDQKIDQALYNHYQILLYNPEYHLLGNHLLENGFALLFGAYYFKDDELYKEAVKILKNELREQTLADGAHFELSPMYHQTMLVRVLDCVQLIRLNSWKLDDLLQLLENIAVKMLSWLQMITFDNGDIPMVNDSSFGIAPSTEALIAYGNELDLRSIKAELSDSGFRMFKNKKFELFVDVAHIGASYQPGHVHSDTFSFILYANKQPVFVDPGVSTYEKNEVRQQERSTASHNTVQVGDREQTQVWGGFRVAKRASITKLVEGDFLEATHDGYKDLGIEHTRKFTILEEKVIINDKISGGKDFKQTAYFHLHPTITNVLIDASRVLVQDHSIELFFKGENIRIEKGSYRFAAGFNKTQEGIKLKVLFQSTLETAIQL